MNGKSTVSPWLILGVALILFGSALYVYTRTAGTGGGMPAAQCVIDDFCESARGENALTCPEDCTCGDELCSVGEVGSCIADCRAGCGDGVCDASEQQFQDCAVDCAP